MVGDVARVLSALRSGEVDAALVTEHTAPPDLELVPFGSTRTVLITSSGEPAATRPMRLAELAERVLVVRDPGTVNRREIDQLLAEAGVEPAGRLEASSLEAVKRCVEAGLGVASCRASLCAASWSSGRCANASSGRPRRPSGCAPSTGTRNILLPSLKMTSLLSGLPIGDCWRVRVGETLEAATVNIGAPKVKTIFHPGNNDVVATASAALNAIKTGDQRANVTTVVKLSWSSSPRKLRAKRRSPP